MSRQKEKIKEFSRQGTKELQNLLRSKKERLRQLRFDLAAGKVKNVREVRGTKKDIARIETVLKLKSEDLSRAARPERPVPSPSAPLRVNSIEGSRMESRDKKLTKLKQSAKAK